MSNNGKQNPFVPAGGGAWKKLERPVQPHSQLSATDSDKKIVLGQLTELFGSVVEQNVIETIASSCGWNVQRSIDALMEVSSNVDALNSPGKAIASNLTSPPREMKPRQSPSTALAASNLASPPREMKPRQSPSTAPALQAIKVAYEGYDDSSDDADVIIEDEEEVQIVGNALPRLAMSPSSLSRTQLQSKPSPKETKRGSVKCAQSLEIDVITESINRGIKIMVLMRGVPGSGKSFLAHKLILDSLLDAQPEQFIFSTDDFFCQSGHYIFSPSKLPEAHEWNRMRVVAALHRGMSPVIVDNTNTEAWEMKPYVHPAVYYGYAIEILEPRTPWCRKESELCRRNTHGVPRHNIRNMLERYEKTSVADLMLRFACSYAYGNTPPQACSNKPKLKSARKMQRENGGRRKSASEPRDNSWSKPAVGRQVKNEELQDKKVVSTSHLPPQPQRTPKPAAPNTVSVAAVEKNVQVTTVQKDAVKPSEPVTVSSVGNLLDIQPPVTRSTNTESDLEKSVTPTLKCDDGDVLAKMKRDLKASLRSQGPREETGDMVQEMFLEDVLVRLGQKEAQRTGLSAEARLETMDREVDQLMDEMWVHFVQLNGTTSIDSHKDKVAEFATELGKDAKDQRGSDAFTADDGNEAEIESSDDTNDQPDYEMTTALDDKETKTNIEFQGDAKEQRDCVIERNVSNADEVKVAAGTETESRETDTGLDVKNQHSCIPLGANVDLEASEDVASDLIETLIKSVDSVLDRAEEKESASITVDSTEVPVVSDTEKIVDVGEVPNVSSTTTDFSMSAEYSLVDLVPSESSSLTVGDMKTESVNYASSVINEQEPPTPTTESTKQEASIVASSVVPDILLPKEPTSEPEKPAPKQSGLFSWLFPRKPVAALEISVPPKEDLVLGLSDPTFTVFDQGVNCSPEKQLHSINQDVNLLEISNPIDSQPETANIGDCSESSKQAESLLADDEGLSLLLDAADLNNKLDKLVDETAAGGQTENLEKKSECQQDVSDALARFAVEEKAIDLLLSEINQSSEEKSEGVAITDQPMEILPADSVPKTEEKSEGLNISDDHKSFEIAPSSSIPLASKKSEGLDGISQSVEIPPADSTSETTEKSDVLADTGSIPDLTGFTNPWAEAHVASPPPPPPTDLKPRKPKATRDSATNTAHADFSAADFTEKGSVPSELTVVSARCRSINGDDSTSEDAEEEERTRPAVFSLDKGCMTSPVENEPRQHDFDLLVNMFPRIGADDLREVFDKCRHEINWAVELLLESGYDFEPRDDVDTGFDVAQGLETTQHLLEELNTRDLGIIQEASTKQESAPQPEPTTFPSDLPKPEPTTSSPTAKKSPKKPSQLTLALQRQVESSVRIGESFYSEHTLKLRRQRHGETEPSETEPPGPDSESEAMESEDEALPLTLDAEFLQQLQRLFGQLPFQYPDGVQPVVQLPLALARQIHGYLIESQQQQLDKQEEYFQNMIKDEEFARRLQQEEMPAPDLREIMDMELALELYRASQRDPNPARDDLATRLSRQKLLQRFPDVNRDVLAEVFAAHDYSFADTVDVIDASVRADDKPVKNVMSPEALQALEKQLIKQAQEESKKQSQSCMVDNAAGAAGWSAVGARETPAMDSARNYREEALKLVQLRGECFRKANDAHRNGQTAVASYYAQVGHLYKEHIEKANSRAAAALLAANAEDRQSTTLDLHFLYVAEAMEALDIFLDHHIAALASAGTSDTRPLFIITGAGHNSAGGRARIKPAVERRLVQRKAKFVQVNPGMLKVTATKNLMLSSAL